MEHDASMTRFPDLREELAAFNEARRKLLNGKPIDPEGEVVLMPAEDER